jgi:hypothetical protein
MISTFLSQIALLRLSLCLRPLGLNVYLLRCHSLSLPVYPVLPPFLLFLWAAVALSPEPHSRYWTPSPTVDRRIFPVRHYHPTLLPRGL